MRDRLCRAIKGTQVLRRRIKETALGVPSQPEKFRRAYVSLCTLTRESAVVLLIIVTDYCCLQEMPHVRFMPLSGGDTCSDSIATLMSLLLRAVESADM
jgi:hypothetical protein